MARNPEIEEILLRVDLVGLIGTTIKLTRSGRSYKGLCPFHAEKTPSFHVYPPEGTKSGFFHCFGCKKGGDALTFLVDRDGLSFQEALEQLANRAGMEVPRNIRGVSLSKKRSRFDFLSQCQAHFRSNLRHAARGQEAREYLDKRQVDKHWIDHFGLGYAMNAWDGLVQALGKNSDNVDLGLSLGVIKKRENGEGHWDFFRNRLTFPIQTASGEIIAFAGRDLSGDSQAKYLNTPESDLFKKSRVLYGLHQSRELIRETRTAIVVEGYFDVIRMHSCGFANTIAPMGTALTPDHLMILERQCDDIILLFDGDRAGRMAALRTVQLAWDLEARTRVAHLPSGVDPDDFLLSNPSEAMAQLLEGAVPAFNYLLDQILEETGLDSPEQIRKAVDRVFDALKGMKSNTLLDLRLKELADRIHIPLTNIRYDWNQKRTRDGHSRVPASSPNGSPQHIQNNPIVTPEEEARKGLQILLLKDESKIEELIGDKLNTHPTSRACLEKALNVLKEQTEKDDLVLFLSAYLDGGVSSARNMLEQGDEDSILWEVEAILREERIPEDPLRTLEDYTDVIVRSYMDRMVDQYRKALLAAQAEHRWDQLQQIAMKVDELVKERDIILSKGKEVR